MKPPKGVRKAVKAFLGVRKRDVSRWPELDRPVDYKDRLQTSKDNYGIDTHGLKPEYQGSKSTSSREDRRPRSVSQPPPIQRAPQDWEDRDSAFDQEEDQYLQYAPHHHDQHHDWDLMPPQLPPKSQQPPPPPQEQIQRSNPGVEHLKDPWDDHKASTLPGSHLPGPRVGRPSATASTSKDTRSQTSVTSQHDPTQHQQQQQRGRSMGRKMTSQTVTGSSKTTDIDERLKSCMSELDRLTSQLDTVVTLTEKLDQMRDEVANSNGVVDNETNEPISVPYCNQAPHSKPHPQSDHINSDYHRGIIQGSTAPTPHEEKNNLPPRLPSRTPSSTNKFLTAPPSAPVITAPPPSDHDNRMRSRHHIPPNKRLHQIQEDQWSSSGYSSGSFESIPSYPPYMHHHDPYGTYQRHMTPHDSSYASSMTPSYDPYYQEDSYGEYGIYQPAAASSDGWYYLTPSSMDGSVSGYRGGPGHESVYQFGPADTYEEWGSYGSYNYPPQPPTSAKTAREYHQQRMAPPTDARRFDQQRYQQQHDTSADSSSSSREFPSRSVSSDSSGKRKTVRFSKTVQERHEEKETTSAMKGSPEENKKRRKQQQEAAANNTADQPIQVYEFPEGHIESSCMCDDCILARRSLEQQQQQHRHEYTYYA